MEHLVLKVLSFDLAAPTINQFLTQYFLHQSVGKRVENLARVSFQQSCLFTPSKTWPKTKLDFQYLGELSLVDSDPFLKYLPSHMAAAAIALANNTVTGGSWVSLKWYLPSNMSKKFMFWNYSCGQTAFRLWCSYQYLCPVGLSVEGGGLLLLMHVWLRYWVTIFRTLWIVKTFIKYLHPIPVLSPVQIPGRGDRIHPGRFAPVYQRFAQTLPRCSSACPASSSGEVQGSQVCWCWWAIYSRIHFK